MAGIPAQARPGAAAASTLAFPASAPADTAAAQASAAVRRAGVDYGRLVMVPLAVLLLVGDAGILGRAATRSHSASGALLGGTDALLMCAFYLLIIWCYLRRGRAIATSRSVSGSVVAVVATFMPFGFPVLATAAPSTGVQLAGDLLLVVGIGWSIWSLRHLGRNLSVVPQARGVSERGPYRLVRHPLYLGEIVSSLGLALVAGSARALLPWVALVLMQAYRAYREEQVLLATLPGYRHYRSRTAALIPGIF